MLETSPWGDREGNEPEMREASFRAAAGLENKLQNEQGCQKVRCELDLGQC